MSRASRTYLERSRILGPVRPLGYFAPLRSPKRPIQPLSDLVAPDSPSSHVKAVTDPKRPAFIEDGDRCCPADADP